MKTDADAGTQAKRAGGSGHRRGQGMLDVAFDREGVEPAPRPLSPPEPDWKGPMQIAHSTSTQRIPTQVPEPSPRPFYAVTRNVLGCLANVMNDVDAVAWSRARRT